MNAIEYQELAARTLIDRPDLEIPDNEIMIIWNAIELAGKISEIAELIEKWVYRDHKNNLDKANLEKEIGDLLWYIAGIYTKLNVGMPETNEVPEPYTTMESPILWHLIRLHISTGKVTELVKGIFHQHGLDKWAVMLALKKSLEQIAYICAIARLHNISEIMQGNINKQMIRYPNGFSSEDSQRRIDTQ